MFEQAGLRSREYEDYDVIRWLPAATESVGSLNQIRDQSASFSAIQFN